MAKETFLGIKRVEALLKIVDEKRKDALNSIEKIPEHETPEAKINDIKLFTHIYQKRLKASQPLNRNSTLKFFASMKSIV